MTQDIGKIINPITKRNIQSDGETAHKLYNDHNRGVLKLNENTYEILRHNFYQDDFERYRHTELKKAEEKNAKSILGEFKKYDNYSKIPQNSSFQNSLKNKFYNLKTLEPERFQYLMNDSDNTIELDTIEIDTIEIDIFYVKYRAAVLNWQEGISNFIIPPTKQTFDEKCQINYNNEKYNMKISKKEPIGENSICGNCFSTDKNGIISIGKSKKGSFKSGTTTKTFDGYDVEKNPGNVLITNFKYLSADGGSQANQYIEVLSMIKIADRFLSQSSGLDHHIKFLFIIDGKIPKQSKICNIINNDLLTVRTSSGRLLC
jgi:hypothetical protein